jgi:hypothetical protein
MKRSLLAFLVVFGLALSLSVSPALAILIDFGTGMTGQGGSITFLNGGAKGVGIPVGSVTIGDAPLGNGDYFTSGAFAYTLPPPLNTPLTAAVLDFDYEPNLQVPINTVTITGDISGLVGDMTLLSGSFSSFTATLSGAGMGISGGGSDTKARELMIALGMDPLTQWNFFGFSLTGTAIPGDGWKAISTDFKNTVPEPGILILLGIGLSAVGILSRRIKL